MQRFLYKFTNKAAFFFAWICLDSISKHWSLVMLFSVRITASLLAEIFFYISTLGYAHLKFSGWIDEPVPLQLWNRFFFLDAKSVSLWSFYPFHFLNTLIGNTGVQTLLWTLNSLHNEVKIIPHLQSFSSLVRGSRTDV